jgi:hypothetical protein
LFNPTLVLRLRTALVFVRVFHASFLFSFAFFTPLFLFTDAYTCALPLTNDTFCVACLCLRSGGIVYKIKSTGAMSAFKAAFGTATEFDFGSYKADFTVPNSGNIETVRACVYACVRTRACV